MDLMVGGAILLALFILITGVLWLKEVSVARKMARYTALFPNIGSLQVGDPVKVNGVKMGSIARIALDKTKVRVAMSLDRSVTLTDSAVVTVQNIGLMGERNIMIQLSDKGTTYLPDRTRDPAAPILVGYFDTGIAEAMGMIGTVLGDVRVVVRNVQTILDNTVGDTSFVIFFRAVVGRLDTVTMLAQSLVQTNEQPINQSVANIREATGDMRRLLSENRENINVLLANGTQLSTQAVRIASDVESLTVSLQQMVDEVERGEGTVGKLFKDESFYRDLQKTVAKVDTLATDVEERGLKLRIKFGFRDRKKQKQD
jgi:phospholipid/cholesterol/gamma-HCH transport system substrate-binding protein